MCTVLAYTARPTPPAGPEHWERLPDVSLLDVGTGERATLLGIAAQSGGCILVTFVKSTCPVCTRMRSDWSNRVRRWRDSTDVHVRPYWISAEDPTVLRRFVIGANLEGVRVLAVADDAPKAFLGLGVFATPISYLVSRDGVHQFGVLGPELPPSKVASDVCRAD